MNELLSFNNSDKIVIIYVGRYYTSCDIIHFNFHPVFANFFNVGSVKVCIKRNIFKFKLLYLNLTLKHHLLSLLSNFLQWQRRTPSNLE